MQMAVNRGDPSGNEKVQCGFGRLPSRLPETPDVTFWMWNERRRLCSPPFGTLWLQGEQRPGRGRGQHSGVLFLITDQLALVWAGVPFAQEVLPDGLQLRQLQPDLLQVVGPPVPDLPQGEWVQVPKGDPDQLPGRTWQRQSIGGVR